MGKKNYKTGDLPVPDSVFRDSKLQASTSRASLPPHVQKSVTRAAIKIYSSYREWEASTESCDTKGSPRTCLLFGKYRAFRKLQLRLFRS
jgi:hypothetical protein